jgi:hypothetical protein
MDDCGEGVEDDFGHGLTGAVRTAIGLGDGDGVVESVPAPVRMVESDNRVLQRKRAVCSPTLLPVLGPRVLIAFAGASVDALCGSVVGCSVGLV